MTGAIIFAALVISTLVIASLVWLYLVGLTIREYRKTASSNESPRLQR